MELAEFLFRQGYRKIDLISGGMGHFHAPGSLSGHQVDVVMDTGAASTVADLSLVRDFGLELEKLPYQGGGAGGAGLDLFQIKDAILDVDGVIVRTAAVIAMDLSHVNEALAGKGQSPVQVILGIDVFSAQAAIIDYGTKSLFLRA
jgi:hypothetical protein